ncbi:hypothetical protein BUALT_Bualt08G0111300 [Buddleja alternifolia]|uniref:Uncharacterized protein n=1 Tax=Buddleja alternifolia TaxID=168488 RepID=A0AAV6XDS4_9LAMI|nr:hypothetical protein BUALT_Bualt08G0111300 [Buddleja alternifolia]
MMRCDGLGQEFAEDNSIGMKKINHSVSENSDDRKNDQKLDLFDSKRFCRDCRRNVIREFKELKELKCMRKFLVIRFKLIGIKHFQMLLVNGLDLSGMNACYISLRAWKKDGRCNELCVMAHALRGQQCVHCRLVVGDGFVTITRGESITRFFEHAEEAEEEVDDDSMDKDGNELDGEHSRPQKHAKSPELAREFLLDAATVIFKEQTYPVIPDVLKEESTPYINEVTNVVSSRDLVGETGEATPSSPISPDIQDDQLLTEYMFSNMQSHSENVPDEEFGNPRDWNTSFPYDHHIKYSRRKQKFHGFESTRSINGFNKQLRSNAAKSNIRNGGTKLNEKFTCTYNRTVDRHDSHACSCNHHNEYRSRPDLHITRLVREPKYVNKLESSSDISKPYYRVTLRSTPKVETFESDQPHESSSSTSSNEVTDISVQTNHDDNDVRELTRIRAENCGDNDNGLHLMAKSQKYSKDAVAEDVELCSMTRSPLGKPHELCFISSSSNSAPPALVRSTSRGQEAKSPGTASTKNISLSSLSKEAAPYVENGRANVNIGAMSENVLPQMHNRNIHYPVIPATSMGYYHQSPVSWPAGPTNGLMSFPHSNHYLFANTFGYGLNGNARFMQYGPMQHMATPVLNHGHLPVFQPVSQVNGVSTKEPTKVAHGLKEAQPSRQKVVSTDQDSGQNGKSDKIDSGNNDFSLFHFGGPVALSTGFKSDHVSLKVGIMGDISPNSSVNCPDGDNPCHKKDTMEEYNLFAASNGIKFSIF